MQPCLLIRADASPEIGTGHLMRCLALAQAWQERGGTATFALATEASALEERLVAEKMEVARLGAIPGSAEDAEQTVSLARDAGAAWVVVDGYQFDGAYQRCIKDADLSLLVVDDYGHADHYYADLVLNQNINAEASLYARRESYTQLLLGTRYAVLRREFRAMRDRRKREQPDVARKILVTLGGGDPDNVTLKVVEALAASSIAGLEAVLVMGVSNPHYSAIHVSAEKAGRNIQLRRNVTDMAGLMTWADVAVSAGGSTCWELAFMGIPNLIVVLADNQQGIADGLHQAGVSINLGWHHDIAPIDIAHALDVLLSNKACRTEMSHKGQLLVDGSGSERVVSLGLLQSVGVA